MEKCVTCVSLKVKTGQLVTTIPVWEFGAVWANFARPDFLEFDIYIFHCKEQNINFSEKLNYMK